MRRCSAGIAIALLVMMAGACGEDPNVYGVPLLNANALATLETSSGLASDPCRTIPDLPASFLNAMPACCGGKGRCVPEIASLGKRADQLPSCEGGGKCVPSSVLQASTNPPKACRAGSDGAAGVCFPTCIDAVDRLKLLLSQAECDPDERCVPCLTPQGTPTGLCEYGTRVQTPKPATCLDAPSERPRPELCANPPRIIDPRKLTPCDAGHCIPKSIAGDMAARLSSCADSTQVCTPDDFIATGGLFVPKTCKSLVGGEGRCLSTAIPEVKDQADRLPRDVCGNEERCAPCFDPVTGEALSSCELTCDSGPKQPKRLFESCGGTKGRCVSKSLVGSELVNFVLNQDKCKADEKCVPLAVLNRRATPAKCVSSGIFSSGSPGVCVESVFTQVLSILGSVVGVSQSNCKKDFVCVPCDVAGDAVPGCAAPSGSR